MQTILITALSLHILSSMFWAGSSFVLARTGGAGAEQLFRPQMGAAAIAILTGGYLWSLLHADSFGPGEKVLALGAILALFAAAVQGMLVGRAAGDRSRMVLGERIGSGLLAGTVICMAAARYV